MPGEGEQLFLSAIALAKEEGTFPPEADQPLAEAHFKL